MSITHSEGSQNQVNPHGYHIATWERHPCFIHADLIDTGTPLFRAGPGPRVVELVGPLQPLYYRQSDKIARRAGRGQALFWLTQRQLLRLTRGMQAWFREPPPDSELLLAEVVVNVWLPGPDPRAWVLIRVRRQRIVILISICCVRSGIRSTVTTPRAKRRTLCRISAILMPGSGAAMCRSHRRGGTSHEHTNGGHRRHCRGQPGVAGRWPGVLDRSGRLCDFGAGAGPGAVVAAAG